MKPGMAAMSVFVGLNASNEELGLRAHNVWSFTSNEAVGEFEKYVDMEVDDMAVTEVPLVFVSFPSAKDPNWKNHKGRESKSTCAIVTLANWEWYKEFEKKPLKKRGDEYEAVGYGDVFKPEN